MNAWVDGSLKTDWWTSQQSQRVAQTYGDSYDLRLVPQVQRGTDSTPPQRLLLSDARYQHTTRSQAVASIADRTAWQLLSNSISSCFWDYRVLSVGLLRVTTLPARVTWRHRLRGDSIPHRQFPICFFSQFFGKTHRLATTHTLQTTDRQTDETL